MSSRLRWLLIALFGLVVLRLTVPPRSPAPAAVAEAIVRKPHSDISTTLGPAATVNAPFIPEVDAPAHEASAEITVAPGNAFAVRPAPAPPYVPVERPTPSSSQAARVVPRVEEVPPTTPPPAPTAPFTVIGTWDDGHAPGVFLASSGGTLLARPGTVLQADYLVQSVSAHQVVLVQQSSRQEFRLNVPVVPKSLPSP